jgi:hypothetical protein
MHKAMLHHWVKNPVFGRVGQVRKVYKDPQTKKQAGVLVMVPGDKALSFWPTELVRAAKPPKTKRAKSKRHAKR